MAQEASDAELITAVRTGDDDAYARLYRRHHSAALRYARSLAGSSAEAEDLVSDAFTRVLAALRGGNGPDEAFRPYLLSAVRNAFYDLTRRATRERPVDDLTPLAPDAPFVDPVLVKDEQRLVATAFSELPERWQVVLWHTEVEGEKPATVAPLLGISANAVAALAYRAREGLRERYLHAHLSTTTDEQCRPTTERLAAYTRNKLSKPEAKRVQQHLDECDRCRLLFIELADINSRLGALLGPIVLGASVSYVPGSGPALGIDRLLRRPEAQVAGGAVGLAAIVALVVALVGGAAPPPPGSDPLTNPSRRAPAALTPSWTGDPTSDHGAPPQPTTPSNGASPATTAPSASLSPGPTPVPRPTPLPTASSSTGPGPTPSSPTGPGPTPSPSTTVPAAPDPTPSTPPPVTLSIRLGIGVLIRGLPGLIVLAVVNPTAEGPTARLSLTVDLPDGVTLRSADAGDGWTCAPTDGGAVCERDGLRPRGATLAIIQVSVGLDAVGGLVSALLTGEGLAPITVIAEVGL